MPINNNDVLVAPIGFGDISSAIGQASLDLGTLCRSALINKWARCKPFRNSAAGFASEAARNLARQTANYGLSVPSVGYSDINSMIAGLANSDWTYLQPRGIKNTALNPTNSDELYRALDFDGYDNQATAPIYPIQSITDLTTSEASMDAGLGFGRNIASQTGYLTLADIHVDGHSISDSFGEYYFGICLYYSNTIRYATTMPGKYKEISASLSEIGLSVRGVSAPGSGQTRTYRAIPFFATIAFNSMPSNYAGTMFPMPFAECSVRITRTADVWCSVIMYTLSGSEVPLYYQYKITNPTTSARTYAVNVWALRSYNINDTYGGAVRQDTGTSVAAQNSYTSPLYTLTDGIRVRDILANASFAGVEIRVGEARQAQAISSIILDADPSDPPSI